MAPIGCVEAKGEGVDTKGGGHSEHKLRDCEQHFQVQSKIILLV